MDGEGGGWMECCSLGGLLKLLELFSVFTAMMLHRVGNTGLQGSGWQDQGGGEVFFGAADMVLDREDVRYPMEADAEIVGTGATTAFLIITPMILIAYVVEGRKAIQAMKLDAMFCLVGAGTLIAAGGMTCFAWNNMVSTATNSVNPYNFQSGGALGVVTILSGIIYLVDFFYVMYQNAILTPQDY